MGDKDLPNIWDKLIPIFILIFLVGFIVVICTIGPKYDKSCLKEYGKNYCEENNLTFELMDDWNSFFCQNESNSRLIHFSHEKYYFIESEKLDCIIKESLAFRKIENKRI